MFSAGSKSPTKKCLSFISSGQSNDLYSSDENYSQNFMIFYGKKMMKQFLFLLLLLPMTGWSMCLEFYLDKNGQSHAVQCGQGGLMLKCGPEQYWDGETCRDIEIIKSCNHVSKSNKSIISIFIFTKWNLIYSIFIFFYKLTILTISQI